MTCSTLVSILAIRQILFLRLEKRVTRSLIHEVEEFRLLELKILTNRQPSQQDITDAFDKFLAHNVPEDDEFFITLLNGQLYKSSSEALPAPLKPGSDLIKRWAQATQPQQGEEQTTVGTIRYLVEPLRIRYKVEPIAGANQAVFVVAHVTTSERQEVDEAVFVVIQVTMSVLVLTSLMAWIAAGQLLAPLRLLTETTRTISESDLSQRIPVKGSNEIAELANTFNEMLDRLQMAFASQRDFINDAGHELRTPITIIRGHLELLGDDPQERRETLELVTDELDRMNRFVDDLLLLAKAEQPNFLKLETIDIGLLIEEIYTKATALGDRNWCIDNKGTGQIVADRQRLTQAMVNLAQNATQHTKPEDAIALGVVLKKDKARFWVRDTGVGIPYSEQTKIFDRFARATNSQRRSDGAGLGLAIVRAIALAHGGTVELYSQPGDGSTFTIVIPVESSARGLIS